MNKNHESPRARKYPAAAAAMVHYLVIERMPDKNRPRPPGTNFPAFLNETFGDDAAPDYDRKGRDDEERFDPSPRQIDAAVGWLNSARCSCRWMWQPGWDARDWHMFRAYAHGVSVSGIGAHHNYSRHKAGECLNRIFHKIQHKADNQRVDS